MAEIHPFRAVTFNPEKAGDPGRLVTQPYDKISPELRAAYLERSPYNIVRVILPRPAPGEGGERAYLEAAQLLNHWQERRIMVRREQPAIFPYHQRFTVPGSGDQITRQGFVALGRLYDYSTGVVRPHEHTHSGPKLDRLLLTRATGCQFGLLFMLYHDPELAMNSLLDQAAGSSAPMIAVEDDYGVSHRMWAVESPEAIRQAQELMRLKTLYIADGHHRYETALGYWREQVQLGVPTIGPESIDRAMMAFVSLEDQGLKVLPTHRVVYGVPDFSTERLLDELRVNFLVELQGQADEKTLRRGLEELGGRQHCLLYAAADDDKLYRLQLKPKTDLSRLIPGESSRDWKALDVNLLHQVILEPSLGIGERQLDRQENVLFLREPEAALALVRDQATPHQAAFFLKPAKVQEVVAVADHGEVMPQKSTDFYPKMLTGMVINKINRF